VAEFHNKSNSRISKFVKPNIWVSDLSQSSIFYCQFNLSFLVHMTYFKIKFQSLPVPNVFLSQTGSTTSYHLCACEIPRYKTQFTLVTSTMKASVLKTVKYQTLLWSGVPVCMTPSHVVNIPRKELLPFPNLGWRYQYEYWQRGLLQESGQEGCTGLYSVLFYSNTEVSCLD